MASVLERPPLAEIVGRNLHRFRVLRVPKMSQEVLAEAAGINPNTVALIESARYPGRSVPSPRLDTLERLAEALGVEPARLLDWPTPSYRSGKRKLHAVMTSARRQKSTIDLPLVVLAR